MEAASHMGLRQEQMAAEVESLRLLLSEKQMLLATCESVLEDAALQLEATAATCDAETMGHIVEVASGLRQLIREQERRAAEAAPDPAPGSPGPGGGGSGGGAAGRGVVHGVHYDVSHEISDLHDRISMRLDGMAGAAQGAPVMPA